MNKGYQEDLDPSLRLNPAVMFDLNPFDLNFLVLLLSNYIIVSHSAPP